MREWNGSYMTGFALGVLIVAVILLAFGLRERKIHGEYDERQMMIRGKAYQLAFFSLLGYMAVDALAINLWRPWAEPGVDLFLGIFLAVAIFLAACIRQDAFVSVRSSPTAMMLVAAIVMVCQLVNIVANGLGGIVENGLLTNEVLSVACFLVFGLELVMLWAHGRKRADEDGEEV